MFSTKSILFTSERSSIEFVSHETYRNIPFIMDLLLFVVVAAVNCIVVQTVENCETATITVHDEYQSELIDVCSKYKHGSWFTV